MLLIKQLNTLKQRRNGDLMASDLLRWRMEEAARYYQIPIVYNREDLAKKIESLPEKSIVVFIDGENRREVNES